MALSLLLILVTLILSAFFSGIEIAYLSANKLQIELQVQQGEFSGKVLAKFLKKPSMFIGTTLIGNTISLVLYGILMAQLLVPEIHELAGPSFDNEAAILVLQTVISTLIVLFTAEFLPKSLFMINPNRMLTVFAVPFNIIYYLLFPAVFTIVSVSKIVIQKILRVEYSDEKPVFGLTDLNNYLKTMLHIRHENSDVQVDQEIFHNALQFKTVRVRDCMIPRTEIAAVDLNDGMEKLKQAFLETGHSKIIVYKDKIDDVIGYCHSSALFKKPENIESILTPIIAVPETTLANELMLRLIEEQKSLAIVIDEFGGTSGIVSMEDVIEEIFGEIEDEHDEDDLIEQKIDDKNWLLSARLEIEYLRETYSWPLPAGDYDTLGGLILSHTEDIPKPGETVSIPPILLTVQSTLDNRIDTVKLTLLD